MPAIQRVPRTQAQSRAGEDLGDLLQGLLAARGQKLQRRMLAATMNTLAAWLSVQSRLLSDADAAELDDADPPPSAVRLMPTIGSDPSNTLTPRELEVVSRIARGYSNRQIADDLVIAVSTTERHVANILNKLGMRCRAQVAAWAAQHELS